MRVLIAEEDPALASFVRKGLEAEHYAVDVSPDGEQVRSLATELAYDLLILDLNLARVDGVTILRHLRTRKPSMPILVLTSRNRVEDRVNASIWAPTITWANHFPTPSFRHESALYCGVATFRQHRWSR